MMLVSWKFGSVISFSISGNVLKDWCYFLIVKQCLEELLVKHSGLRGFFCTYVFNYRFNFFNSNLELEIFFLFNCWVFQWICPFHLNFQKLWQKVVCNILSSFYAKIYSNISFFTTNISYLGPFPFFLDQSC